jgi:hypothetical protein
MYDFPSSISHPEAASGQPRFIMASWRVEQAADTEMRATMDGLGEGGVEGEGRGARAQTDSV